jgi:hypothetical protein
MALAADQFVLFMRHADRPPIPPDDPYADVDLTPEGYAAVAALALALPAPVAWAATSPYKRCQVTARCFGVDPEIDTRLGRHGPWIESREDAVKEFAARGSMGVVRALVEGTKLPGMRAPEEAVPILLSVAIERLGRGNGVCVSHYSILMPAMAWLFGPTAAAEQLSPLNGFTLRVRQGAVFAFWNGQELCVDDLP